MDQPAFPILSSVCSVRPCYQRPSHPNVFVNEMQDDHVHDGVTITQGHSVTGSSNTILLPVLFSKDAFSLFPKACAIGGGAREEL